jgi:hypothetical protein
MDSKMQSILFVFLLFILVTGNARGQQCPFDSTDEDRLARCLIRPVSRGGNVGQIPGTLPAVLKDLIGKSTTIDLIKLRKHLTDNAINESDIGGVINQDLSKVRYFVIHDTSSPEISESAFPANINESSWSSNRLSRWINSSAPTHVYVNRVGESATKANFSIVVGATKYEAGRDISNSARRRQARQNRGGQFVHIELIQPRRKSNPRTFFDLAPSPGFTQKQLDRLALLYIAVSYRSKRWLLPAFHASVDATIADAHDDPQNFDMDSWLNSIEILLGKLQQ